jgi:hypothetical protein
LAKTAPKSHVGNIPTWLFLFSNEEKAYLQKLSRAKSRAAVYEGGSTGREAIPGGEVSASISDPDPFFPILSIRESFSILFVTVRPPTSFLISRPPLA